MLQLGKGPSHAGLKHAKEDRPGPDGFNRGIAELSWAPSAGPRRIGKAFPEGFEEGDTGLIWSSWGTRTARRQYLSRNRPA